MSARMAFWPAIAGGVPRGGIPTVFVGMYATLGMSTSQHFVHAQYRSVISEIEPPTRPRPLARVLDQASFYGIVVHVIQFFISRLRAPDAHVPVAHTSRQKEAVKKLSGARIRSPAAPSFCGSYRPRL